LENKTRCDAKYLGKKQRVWVKEPPPPARSEGKRRGENGFFGMGEKKDGGGSSKERCKGLHERTETPILRSTLKKNGSKRHRNRRGTIWHSDL